MAELFQTTVPSINIHIKNIFDEGELQPGSVVKDYLITAADGKKYKAKFYNLDMIVSVGYRERGVLPGAGQVSHKAAQAKAGREYEAFSARRRAALEAQAEQEIIYQLERTAKELPKPAEKRREKNEDGAD